MKVIVDTCVWSLALRRQKPDHDHPFVIELQELVKEARVQLVGPIRQEILSGISNQNQFEKLKNILKTFHDLPLSTDVYEEAANYYNINREKGIQGSHTDFLLCAISSIYTMPILTLDKDFQLFQKNISFKIHQPRIV